MDAAEALALFGTAQAVAPARRLSAGGLSCDLYEGGVRDVCWGDVEVMRGISYLLRDRDWGTVPVSVRTIEIAESATSFQARFELLWDTPAGTLVATARLHGDARGRLMFEVIATADAPIETNRCGFVLLHPAAVAGTPVRVVHTDGTIDEAKFPREISPSQPILDIREMTYAASDSVELRCRLEAQLPADPAGKFEMEDQRNWSDASFKTYVASLLDPWPYVLPEGKTLTQSINLSVKAITPPERIVSGGTPLVRLGAPLSQRMPALGVGVPPGLSRASAAELAALRDLAAGWWIVEGALEDKKLPLDLAAVAAQRAGLAARVQIDVIAPATLLPEDAARWAAELCADAKLDVDAVRLLPAPFLKSYQPTDRWPDLPSLEAYAHAARRHFGGALIGGGMFTFFTELNRKRPAADGLDFIGHATCPIVHAADDASVMQTMEALPHIAHSVRTIWPALPYRLGPSTIAMRHNPYGDAPAPNRERKRVAMAAVDPRHGAKFGAAWTVAYAAAVAPLGLEVLALHHSHGPSGPLAAPNAGVGTTIPAWSVLRLLAKAARSQFVPIENLPEQVVGIAWQDGGAIKGVVANIADRPCRLRWQEAVLVDSEELPGEMTLGPYETAGLVFAHA